MTEDVAPPLRDTPTDTAAAILRIACGIAGPVGSFFTEFIDHILPDTKAARLDKFVTRLASRLDEAEKKIDRAFETQREEKVSLLEDGVRAALTSTSDGQINRIADAVASGLTDDHILADQQRRMVELLESISDGDMRILQQIRSGLPPQIELLTEQEVADYRASIEGRPHLGFGQLEIERRRARLPALDYQVARLERMGLIFNQIEISQHDHSRLRPGPASIQARPKGYRLTPLAKHILALSTGNGDDGGYGQVPGTIFRQ
ncbi:MAG: hypothetical protein QM608_17135 [Caulobacter sp.]